MQICLSGSSAKLLSREIGTQLRGRSLTTEIFPFSFREYLRHRGIDDSPDPPGSRRLALLENRFSAYLMEGGFPEVQGLDTRVRVRVLQEYLDGVVFRDVVERYRIRSTVPVRYLIRHLMNSPAGLFSVNRFHNDLRSQGITTGKNKLYEYFEHLVDAYLFYPVYMHTSSERARMVNPRKVYVVDTGLARACSRRVDANWGHLLENLVFMHVRRTRAHVEYYRTTSGKEVDFAVTVPERGLCLVQVCADLSDPGTRNREVGSLAEAMEECRVGQGTIVTMNQQETFKCPAGEIQIRPGWMWALQQG